MRGNGHSQPRSTMSIQKKNAVEACKTYTFKQLSVYPLPTLVAETCLSFSGRSESSRNFRKKGGVFTWFWTPHLTTSLHLTFFRCELIGLYVLDNHVVEMTFIVEASAGLAKPVLPACHLISHTSVFTHTECS